MATTLMNWIKVNTAAGGRDKLIGAFIKIHEVAPRDGLQFEKKFLSTQEKLVLIENLCQMKPSSIEVTSFVRPDKVPQLADADELCKALFDGSCPAALEARKRNIKFAGLVPNIRGYERFMLSKLDTVSVLTSATDSHSKANMGKGMKEALRDTCNVIKLAKKDGVNVRAYVSMAFACPFEDDVDEDNVMRIVESYADSGADTIVLCDTVGKAYVSQIRSLVSKCTKVGVLPHNLGLHMHDVQGSGILNIAAGMELGIRHIDAAVGGIGGCPFAGDGVSPNASTAMVMKVIERMEGVHKMDEEFMLDARDYLRRLLPYRKGGIN